MTWSTKVSCENWECCSDKLSVIKIMLVKCLCLWLRLSLINTGSGVSIFFRFHHKVGSVRPTSDTGFRLRQWDMRDLERYVKSKWTRKQGWLRIVTKKKKQKVYCESKGYEKTLLSASPSFLFSVHLTFFFTKTSFPFLRYPLLYFTRSRLPTTCLVFVY